MPQAQADRHPPQCLHAGNLQGAGASAAWARSLPGVGHYRIVAPLPLPLLFAIAIACPARGADTAQRGIRIFDRALDQATRRMDAAATPALSEDSGGRTGGALTLP